MPRNIQTAFQAFSSFNQMHKYKNNINQGCNIIPVCTKIVCGIEERQMHIGYPYYP